MDAKSRLLELMQQKDAKCTVTVSDGRVVSGQFVCVDKHRNIVLHNSKERYANGFTRITGTVMIPGKNLQSISLTSVGN
ncbi:hypothetical protein MIR68_005549 [Amoeboaphelidium protococcarum]|nr:hypothetical protein MIR68_005549 [Amoeboaphelidium protococcarum]